MSTKRKYETMNQKELRAACKAAGISYRGMKVADMREALANVEPPKLTKPVNHRKDAVVKNGVRQPGEGTVCRAVWDALDEVCEIDGIKRSKVPLSAIKALGEAEGWNENNTVIEFYQWRKFHGVKAQRKAAPAAEARASA